jgi:phosphoribosylamine--glycine ligase
MRLMKLVTVLGSKNDLSEIVASKMYEPFEALGLKVPIHVISAHRHAPELYRYCQEAVDIDVFIAVAGMATSLPGAIAGATRIQRVVIAVPLDDGGIDSCIRMPPGVPVLTAGVGRAGLRNAGLAACQIVCAAMPEFREPFAQYLLQSGTKTEFDVALPNSSKT